MMHVGFNDTIAAIGTPVGESGIGIVRISGSKSLLIADRIFLSGDGRKPSVFKSHTTHYGWVVETARPKETLSKVERSQNIIDEVILTVMRKPRSYTKEDIVEINCHGGVLPLRKTLELILDSGARMAKPGEFTQRAFLNGRIDLPQAEAVLDIIRAKTNSALRMSVEQLKGSLSKGLNRLRTRLLQLLVILDAGIDFPGEDLGETDNSSIAYELNQVNRQLQLILSNSSKGRILREGVRVVICGKPNVGKSLLLNVLLRCERSIVTSIAGTTRDTIEEVLDIRGIPIRIVDTAGIIEPGDLIERKAVSRSRRYIKEADLILLVFDGSRDLSCEDEALMRRVKLRPVLAIINKIDKRRRIKCRQIIRQFKRVVEISAKEQRNIDLLEEEVARFVFNGKIKSGQPVWVSNLRHIQQLKKAQKSITHAEKSVKANLSFEFISYDVKQAVGFLDDIQGRRFSGDVLDRIFSEFCIGK